MTPSEEKGIEKVAQRLKSSKRILVLTGAGISKDSGIPTFRGEDGLWKRYIAEILLLFRKIQSLSGSGIGGDRG